MESPVPSPSDAFGPDAVSLNEDSDVPSQILPVVEVLGPMAMANNFYVRSLFTQTLPPAWHISRRAQLLSIESPEAMATVTDHRNVGGSQYWAAAVSVRGSELSPASEEITTYESGTEQTNAFDEFIGAEGRVENGRKYF